MSEEKKLKFEEIKLELETIVSAIEQGNIPLEKSIEQYARGMKLYDMGKEILTQAEKEIETISKKGTNAQSET